MRCERWSPPLGLAVVAPVVRYSRTQRIAVATPTSKRRAAPRRDMPPSTAEIIRPRRSRDTVFAMHAGLLVQRTWRITIASARGSPAESERSDDALVVIQPA